jgi:GNAT superfamily N-acetyltransferase
VTAAHRDFLRTLLSETWIESMRRVGADPAQLALEPLIDLQFRAREQGYAAAYPNAQQYIVSRRASAAPIGRMLLDWTARWASVLIDVAVRPSERAGAVGLQLLRAWLATCDQLRHTARLHVTPENPARRIYACLGFVELTSEAFPIAMERAPRGSEHAG